MSKVSLPAGIYIIGPYTVNCNELTVSNDRDTIKLPVKVFDLLKLFIQSENQSVQRSVAIDIIWEGNKGVGERGFTNAMWHLRKTFSDLGAEPEEVFKTLRKVGYILVLTPEPVITAPIVNAVEEQSQKNAFSVRTWLSLALLLVLILIVTFYWFTNYSSKKVARQQEFNSHRETNYQGMEDHPSISHDGNYLAFRWVQESSKGQLYIKDLANEGAPLRMLTQSNYEESSPAWSPDDASIGYIRKVSNSECEVRVRNLVSNLDIMLDTGCVYNPMRHSLSWSPDGEKLLYPKAYGSEVAIYSFNVNSKKVTQVSFPNKDERDVMAIWGQDSKSIALIREQYVKAKLVFISDEMVERDLLDYDISIVGLAWDHNNNEIYTNLLDDAHYAIHKFSLNTNEWQVVRKISTPSNLSYNEAKGRLFYSRYSAREHITQQKFSDGTKIRKVSSSSRDIYGTYSSDNDDIIFLSNRDNNWDIWLKSQKQSKNLTKGKGVALVPSASPNGQKYAVNIQLPNRKKFSLFLGDIDTGELTELDLGDIEPQHPAWSFDGNDIIFTAANNGISAAYQYNLMTSEVSLISPQSARKVVHGKDHMYYLSREEEAGIWQFNPQTKQYKKIISELAVNDYGAFFWQGDSLFYLTRTDSEDLVKKYVKDGSDIIVTRFPANSIKKYFGISAANDDSFLISLVSLNDADIYTLAVNKIVSPK